MIVQEVLPAYAGMIPGGTQEAAKRGGCSPRMRG